MTPRSADHLTAGPGVTLPAHVGGNPQRGGLCPEQGLLVRLSEGLSPLPSLPGRPSCGSSSEGPGSLYGGAGPAGGADHRGAGRGLGMSQTPGTPQLLSAPPSPQLPSQMQGREGRSVWAHVAKSGRSAPAGGRRVVLGTRTGAHTRMAACSERQPSGRCFCNESSGALSPGNPSLETYVSDRLCTWCAGGGFVLPGVTTRSPQAAL